jgi:hypothetical protein
MDPIGLAPMVNEAELLTAEGETIDPRVLVTRVKKVAGRSAAGFGSRTA